MEVQILQNVVWTWILHETRMWFSRDWSKDQRHAHQRTFARFHLPESTPHKHVGARHRPCPFTTITVRYRRSTLIRPDRKSLVRQIEAWYDTVRGRNVAEVQAIPVIEK
jgi:hypothetical protein